MAKKYRYRDKLPEGEAVPTRPRWVRWLLMLLLIALCGIGFYFTNAVTFERVLNR